MDQLNQFLGNEGRIVFGKEVWQFQQKWREIYAGSLKESTGKWQIGDIDWHVFSYGYFPCLRGMDAQTRFEQRIGDSFYVWSSGDFFSHEALLFDSSLTRPPKDFEDFLHDHNQYYDLYFYSGALDWTMVYTHESDFDKIYAERQ